MPRHPSKAEIKKRDEFDPSYVDRPVPLWNLDIVEPTGHNLEAHGREEVNQLLHDGRRLLLVYTLTYQEDGVWRERPMAILGRPKAQPDRDGGAAAREKI